MPQTKHGLAEGTHVENVVEQATIPAELQEEMKAWDHASDEAWTMIEKWEAEEL